VAIDGTDGDLVRISGLVEKPRAEDAPSNLAIMGRYVLTPTIFDCIDRVPPGRGGEIQLTDAMSLLLGREALFGLPFTAGRYDTGNKLDWLRATVELALTREDLGPGLRKYLAELTKREGIA
jgi:UTP--glucose-1-phosphate uridylyltransferase